MILYINKNIRTDVVLVVILILTLITDFFFQKYNFFFLNILVFTVSLVATFPVVISALKALKNKKISVDLLATVALFFSILNQECFLLFLLI